MKSEYKMFFVIWTAILICVTGMIFANMYGREKMMEIRPNPVLGTITVPTGEYNGIWDILPIPIMIYLSVLIYIALIGKIRRKDDEKRI